MCFYSCLSSLQIWQAFSASSDPRKGPSLTSALHRPLLPTEEEEEEGQAGRVELQMSPLQVGWQSLLPLTLAPPNPSPSPPLGGYFGLDCGGREGAVWNKVPEVRLCSLCCGVGVGPALIYNQFALLGCTLPGPLAREAGSVERP